ncbi:hypothetical protein V8F20_004021 [Naviculisporaceae sp. PSN 640]
MSSSTTTQDSKSAVPVVFITSATGTQGLNLATLLRSPSNGLNWTVRATTRDLSSPAAQQLISLGVNLFPGSWDDTAALTDALTSCTHLFLNTVPSFTDPYLERRQTAQILSLAKTAGVKHVIFSSALGINRLDELPLFVTFPEAKDTVMGQSLYSKAATEQAVRTSGIEHWTILRGGSFMENFVVPKIAYYGPDFKDKRVWRMAMPRGNTLPIVDTLDIAKFAVEAFQEPERFHEKEIEVVGEILKVEDIAAKLDEKWRDDVRGKNIEYQGLTEEEIEQAKKDRNPFVLGQLAIKEMGKWVSAEETKKWGVKVGTLGEFLEREREAVKKTFCLE